MMRLLILVFIIACVPNSHKAPKTVEIHIHTKKELITYTGITNYYTTQDTVIFEFADELLSFKKTQAETSSSEQPEGDTGEPEVRENPLNNLPDDVFIPEYYIEEQQEQVPI